MSWRVHGCLGAVEIDVGTRFQLDVDRSTWEVGSPPVGRIYSPSGFGGTLTFWCRPLGPMTPRYAEYAQDGLVEICGDSIASAIEAGIARSFGLSAWLHDGVYRLLPAGGG